MNVVRIYMVKCVVGSLTTLEFYLYMTNILHVFFLSKNKEICGGRKLK